MVGLKEPLAFRIFWGSVMGVICSPSGFCLVFLRMNASLFFRGATKWKIKSLKRCVLFVHHQRVTLSTKNNLSFSQGKDFITLVPGNGARKMLFLSLYIRLKSTLSMHPKVVRIRRRENFNLRRKSLREIYSLGLSVFELLLNSYVSFNGCPWLFELGLVSCCFKDSVEEV